MKSGRVAKTMANSTIAIALQGVELKVQVGAHPWEKFPAHPSRLHVDLTLVFEYRAYLGVPGGYVDYDPLRAFLKSLEQRDHVETLEEYARDILAAAFKLTSAMRVQLSIMKPDIFAEIDGVGLKLDVAREDLA